MRYCISGKGDWSQEFEVQRDPLGREWKVNALTENPTEDPSAEQELPTPNQELAFEVTRLGPSTLRITFDESSHTVTLLPNNRPGLPLRFLLDDVYRELMVEDNIDLLTKVLASSGGGAQHADVRSVMPGIVTKLLVAEGDDVVKDQPLLVLEAMKMENEICSPVAGTVTNLSLNEGQTVATGDLLTRIVQEPSGE